MSEWLPEKYLDIAKKAALLAGKFLQKNDPSSRIVNQEIDRDIKIEADIQSEKIIVSYLQQHSRYSILSEEQGAIDGSEGEYTWIVDPVDGSLNFSREIPVCCVSIGLWKGDTSVLGVIYDFNRDEMFCGISESGAWLNDKSIQVSSVSDKRKAVLCTGFPIKTNYEPENIEIFVNQIRDFKKIRLMGSAALSIAYVAAGRVEGYYEKDIMLWDVAGGIPIVLGAGGEIEVEKTSKANCLHVCVTNKKIYNSIKMEGSQK